MRKDNDNLIQYFLTATLFILVFFGFYFLINEFKSRPSDEQLTTIDVRKMEKRIDDEVNRHLRSMDTEKRLRALDIDAKNFEMTQSFKDKSTKWKPRDYSSSAEIYDEDLSEGKKDISSLSLEEKLRLEMESNRKIQHVVEEAPQMTREEYIRAYKANALRDGWIVEINENMEIISARRIDE